MMIGQSLILGGTNLQLASRRVYHKQ